MQDVVGYLPTYTVNCSRDSAIHSQLDLVSVRGYQEDFKSTWDFGCQGPSTLQQSLWGRLEAQISLRWVLLRLGTFHTIFNLLSIIGKRFQDAGLRDICTESGIIAEGSVSSVLERDVQSWVSSSHVHRPGLTAVHVETVHSLGN